MRNRPGSWRAGAAMASLPVLAGCAETPVPWAAGLVVLVLAMAAAAGLGYLAARLGARRALLAARQQARLLSDLAGGQVWRTRGQPAVLDDGRRLVEVFEAGQRTTEVEAALGRAAPFGPMLLARRGGGVEELRGLPWYDDDGAFGGLFGVARPMGAQGPHARALDALASAWPDVFVLLMRTDAGAPWQVLVASAEARRLLGDAASLDNGQLAARLPAALGPALQGSDDADHEGWHLVHGTADAGVVLLLWRAGPASDNDSAALSYTVSHDLRAPIRVVEGFTRIVKEDYGSALDRIANDHLDRVLGATARMNQMIDAMLTLARLNTQPMARQPVNLSQLAGFVIDDLRRAAPEREAVVEIEPELQTIGDPTLLRLVLENLLGNAWKYSARRAQTRIVFGRETVDGRSAYVVRDNGAGFDMRSADRLFGLFQRLHSASEFQGTGVGLASVQRIVRRHGGTIWADGEPGRGAAFFFTLRD